MKRIMQVYMPPQVDTKINDHCPKSRTPANMTCGEHWARISEEE